MDVILVKKKGASIQLSTSVQLSVSWKQMEIETTPKYAKLIALTLA